MEQKEARDVLYDLLKVISDPTNAKWRLDQIAAESAAIDQSAAKQEQALVESADNLKAAKEHREAGEAAFAAARAKEQLLSEERKELTEDMRAREDKVSVRESSVAVREQNLANAQEALQRRDSILKAAEVDLAGRKQACDDAQVKASALIEEYTKKAEALKKVVG